MSPRFLPIIVLFLCITFSCNSLHHPDYSGWEVYGGDKEHTHYSTFRQMDTDNVKRLQVAWTYHCGDSSTGTQIQVNPIIVNNILFGVSPKLKLFALEAATGKLVWLFDPLSIREGGNNSNMNFPLNVCRGVCYYKDSNGEGRIFFGAGSSLYCVNALNGKLISSFGDSGKIDLHLGLGEESKNLFVSCTSPGIIYKDLIIIGDRVSEDAAAAPGHIRAYDVHTGKMRWIFHTIPHPGEEGYSSWEDPDAWEHIGGANAWAGFSMDEEKGIVFASLGSASYDFYGGKRGGANLFANCIVALDANTGKRIWHFQTVHHDLWDRDLPTAPVLMNLTKEGKSIPGLAQVTKSGFVFLLDRRTGKPIYPVEETVVPSSSELAGEHPSSTQPIPSFPKPFARQLLTQKGLNTLVPDSSFEDISKRLAGYQSGNMFNPPSKEGTVIFPGYDGGAEWGGPAYDPSTGILYVNASEMPWVLTMVEVKDKPIGPETNLQAGLRLYKSVCMSCHGTQRQGGGNYPSLLDAPKKYNEGQLIQLISSGRRMMPALNQLSPSEKKAIASFVLGLKTIQTQKFITDPKPKNDWYHLPYTSTGYNKFLTKEGYPAVAPPWGTLNAINLNSGELLWKDTLGDYEELKAKGIHSGTENYGGPVVNAGGLLFIAATSDAKIRAFNKRTGKLLWEFDLPASGFATPSLYEIEGKQFLVIACGGGKLKKKSGDAYIAFSLPDR